jgi:nicotinate-nucleotide adenylyltransferase
VNERIAVFGGSFDPPHNGHIHLLVALVERHALDKVLIIPCGQNPLKETMANPEDRFQMAKLAFASFSFCEVLPIETEKTGPSFTVDTLEWLLNHREDFRNAQRFLLFGEDSISTFPRWKNLRHIFEIATPLFASRSSQVNIDGFSEEIRKCISLGITKTAIVDISSTDVRERLKDGENVAHLLPIPVFDYVQKHRLYVKRELS